MKKILLMTLSILLAVTAGAEDGGSKTTTLPVPQRKMLVQGKTWAYVYHHYEDEPQPNGYNETTWLVFYTLKGDTIIDGRNYMKLYRYDERNYSRKYCGAYREDDMGRVYAYNRYGDEKDEKEKKVIDFGLDYGDDPELALYYAPDSIAVETIKVNGQSYRRYRYQHISADGSTGEYPEAAVEGVGFRGKGLAHYVFEPIPTCICDYETLVYVDGDGIMFDDTSFDAPQQIELTATERQLIAGNNDFAFRLFRQGRDEASCIMSPLSITYALGMMNNGAAGQTQQEINQVLGFGEAGADGINQFCRKMLTNAPTLDKETKAEIANTIYVNSGKDYQLQQGFVDKANTYYEAQPEARNFYDGVTRSVINQWANDHTHGMIPAVFPTEEDFNPDAVSYLLNAIYFKGVWASKFDKANTRDESFKGGAKVPMMKQESEFYYAENELYQALQLPYGNGAYQMTLFLPREGKTIADVLATMDGSNWQVKNGGYALVNLKLPRFKTDTDLQLVPIMQELGMPTAFTGDAEFPNFGNRPVLISNMFQKAVIELDEEGTKAAAVTVIEVADAVGPEPPVVKNFHANRPFFYIISEQSTGIIFFMGQYAGEGTRSGLGITRLTRTTDSPAVYDLQGRRVDKAQMKKGLYIVGGKKVVVK